MIFYGVLTGLSFVVIAAKISPSFLKKMLGYQVPVDIASHAFFVGLGALSGTFSGVMAGLIAALCVSGVLSLSRKIMGYTKYENGSWVEHKGTWTISYLTQSIAEAVTRGMSGLIAQIQTGLNAAKKPKEA